MTTGEHDGAGPYVGPRPFRRREPIFGRDRERNALRDLLVAERIVLLYSPSGAGKTSLIQAGLIPTLEDDDDFDVLPVIRVSQPLPHAMLDGLEQAPNRYLMSVLLSLEEGVPLAERIPPTELARLDLTTYLGRRVGTGPRRDTVLIFDQFEEVLNADPTDLEVKWELFRQIGAALRHEQYWALFSLREDYLAGLDPYLDLIPGGTRARFRLDLLRVPAARQAIRRPAELAGVDFKEDAAQTLIDNLRRVTVQQPDGTAREELGPYVEPVQLQVVCLRIWEQRDRAQPVIDTGQVAGQSDVDQALGAFYADQVTLVAGESGIPEQAIRDWVETRLITPGNVRGQVLLEPDQSQGLDNAAIQRLAALHVLRPEQRRGATWFELAHDRLIQPIRENNREWFDLHLSILQKQARLWDRSERPPEQLLRGALLQEADRWAAEHADKVTDAERDLLRESHEQEKRERRERRQTRVLQGLVVLLVMVLGAAIFSWNEATLSAAKASDAERRAVSQRETAQAAGTQTELARATAVFHQEAAQAAATVARSAESAALIDRATAQVAATVANVARATAVANEEAAVTARKNAEQQASLASAGALAASAIAALETDPQQGVMLAIEGVASVPTAMMPAHVEAVLHQAVQASHLERLYQGHPDSMKTVAYSRDGRWLAAGGQDGSVQLWDTTQPRSPSIPLVGNNGPVNGVAFSGDSTVLLAAENGGTVRIWDVATGSEKGVLAGHGAGEIRAKPDPNEPDKIRAVNAVAVSPDGVTVATAGADWTVRIWDLPSGEQLAVLDEHENAAAMAVTFSLDGRRLASGGADWTARVWDSPNGRTGWTPRRWQFSNGKPPDAIRGLLYEYVAVAFGPADASDARGTLLAVGSKNQQAQVWNVETGELLASLEGHKGGTRALAFSRPDGRWLATAGGDRLVKLWDVRPEVNHPDSLRHIAVIVTLAGHAHAVLGLAFSPDGSRIATVSDDRTVRVWSRFERLHGLVVRDVSFSPDGRQIASASRDSTAQIWNAGTGVREAGPFEHVQFRDESEEARGRSGAWVSRSVFSPDGATLATAGADNLAILWDIQQRRRLRVMPHGNEVDDLAFSPDGTRIVTGSRDRLGRIWQAEGDLTPIELKGHGGWVSGVAFNHGGSLIATGGSDSQVRFWNAITGEPEGIVDMRESGVPIGPIWRIAFSPDDLKLAVASLDGTITILDVPSRTVAWSWTAHDGGANSVAFSRDGSRLVTAGDDRTVKLWDGMTFDPVMTLTLTAPVNVAVFDPTGTRLATGGEDRQVQVFELTLSTLRDQACRYVLEPLSDDAQRLYRGSCPVAP